MKPTLRNDEVKVTYEAVGSVMCRANVVFKSLHPRRETPVRGEIPMERNFVEKCQVGLDRRNLLYIQFS